MFESSRARQAQVPQPPTLQPGRWHAAIRLALGMTCRDRQTVETLSRRPNWHVCQLNAAAAIGSSALPGCFAGAQIPSEPESTSSNVSFVTIKWPRLGNWLRTLQLSSQATDPGDGSSRNPNRPTEASLTLISGFLELQPTSRRLHLLSPPPRYRLHHQNPQCSSLLLLRRTIPSSPYQHIWF